MKLWNCAQLAYNLLHSHTHTFVQRNKKVELNFGIISVGEEHIIPKFTRTYLRSKVDCGGSKTKRTNEAKRSRWTVRCVIETVGQRRMALSMYTSADTKALGLHFMYLIECQKSSLRQAYLCSRKP